jgi:hypothetical protein
VFNLLRFKELQIQQVKTGRFRIVGKVTGTDFFGKFVRFATTTLLKAWMLVTGEEVIGSR